MSRGSIVTLIGWCQRARWLVTQERDARVERPRVEEAHAHGLALERSGARAPHRGMDPEPDPDPPGALRPVVEALLYLEEAVTTIEWGEGLALRYGGFYGPGPRPAWLQMP
jgi:hypothetical protein